MCSMKVTEEDGNRNRLYLLLRDQNIKRTPTVLKESEPVSFPRKLNRNGHANGSANKFVLS